MAASSDSRRLSLFAFILSEVSVFLTLAVQSFLANIVSHQVIKREREAGAANGGH